MLDNIGTLSQKLSEAEVEIERLENELRAVRKDRDMVINILDNYPERVGRWLKEMYDKSWFIADYGGYCWDHHHPKVKPLTLKEGLAYLDNGTPSPF